MISTSFLRAAIAAGLLAPSMEVPAPKRARRSIATGPSIGPWPVGSKRYPEQSTRQKLRALRRAQGGPGITEGANPVPYFPQNGHHVWLIEQAVMAGNVDGSAL